MVHEPTLRRFIRSSAPNDCKRGPGPLVAERSGGVVAPYGASMANFLEDLADFKAGWIEQVY
ncbi:hypothetical protein AB0K57_16160, partial [Streptomyces halstedii]